MQRYKAHEGKTKTWSAVRVVLAPALALTNKHAIKETKTYFLSSKAKLALTVYKQTRVQLPSQFTTEHHTDSMFKIKWQQS